MYCGYTSGEVAESMNCGQQGAIGYPSSILRIFAAAPDDKKATVEGAFPKVGLVCHTWEVNKEHTLLETWSEQTIICGNVRSRRLKEGFHEAAPNSNKPGERRDDVVPFLQSSVWRFICHTLFNFTRTLQSPGSPEALLRTQVHNQFNSCGYAHKVCPCAKAFP
ncbi:hypothetical protein BOTBODRAFT_40881 [Botryobasidium botryosum FD-172 SS1]|uniref:Uncharacterized protein n=1 Tax=Botryobasidium botryosum (strain FD-172 SS1) TaxID=930990 RepID=A0A067MZ25_BOTB1|nr:hypothetical protein BOTBODRAFT_40881 [Botryobasidium botryosum FD-172 SS1]